MKKTFFRQATKAEIKRKNQATTKTLINITNLRDDEFTIVFSPVPKGFKPTRKFRKHGEEVRIKRFRSQAHAISHGRTPVQLREQAFNAVTDQDYCAYSIMPLGRDRRKRKVPLVECLEGARIYAYAHQVIGTKIKIRPYSDARRVRFEGAEVIAEVPSRTEGRERHQLKLMSVPIVDSPEKYAIVPNIGSDHSCGTKRFNIRYRYADDKENSGVINLCAHEIAAYFQLVQQELERNKNVIPLQMCPFAIPTQQTVDFYLNLENNVLVRDSSLKSKDKLRKPRVEEKEIALWALVKELGHDRTFYSTLSRDGPLRNYSWE